MPARARLPARAARADHHRRRLRRRHRRDPRSPRRRRTAAHCLHRPAGSPGGKSGALNAALEHARGEVIVVFDADHKCRSDVIKRLVRHFADPTVGAVQGRCIVRNSEESSLAKTIAIDYYCGYLVNEYGRQSLYSLPAYGGANCAVRASSLRALGGWNEDSVTEDTDLTLRLRAERGARALRRHRDRHRRGRADVPPVLAPAVPLGAWASRSVARLPPRGVAVAHAHACAEDRNDDVPARVPRAVAVQPRCPAHLACAWSDSCRGRSTFDLTPIATLLFLGPLLELASGSAS